ncbi:hypothetical protein BDV12DRAFT_32002 [Aspergillus spectabilis]
MSMIHLRSRRSSPVDSDTRYHHYHCSAQITIHASNLPDPQPYLHESPRAPSMAKSKLQTSHDWSGPVYRPSLAGPTVNPTIPARGQAPTVLSYHSLSPRSSLPSQAGRRSDQFPAAKMALSGVCLSRPGLLAILLDSQY